MGIEANHMVRSRRDQARGHRMGAWVTSNGVIRFKLTPFPTAQQLFPWAVAQSPHRTSNAARSSL